jgi:hypothetical protein
VGVTTTGHGRRVQLGGSAPTSVFTVCPASTRAGDRPSSSPSGTSAVPGVPSSDRGGGCRGEEASSPRLAGCPACPGAGGAGGARCRACKRDGTAGLVGWMDQSPPKAAPCSRRVWPHTSIALAGYLALTPALLGQIPPSGAHITGISVRNSNVSQEPFLAISWLWRSPRTTPLITTSTPTVMGTSTPTVMGPQATVYLWVPAKVPFALVRWLSGAESRAKTARDSAPLRYVGVPPTSRLGRTRTPDEGIRLRMWAPAPAGR